MDQTGNNYENIQHTSTNNVGISNMNLNALHINNINSATPASQNVTFEFYCPLPNDTRIYHVTYQFTELHPLENARLLNDRINLSHIPDYQLQHHHNVRSLIQQQIQQQVQQPIVHQRNNTQQQSFDTIQPSQVYSNNNTYDTTSIPTNGTVSYDIQDMRNTNSS
ncbi:hypothetical protein RclHR1_08610011 [Rhizophagus clarus]|uniref:Uncharacterized protein n=1 Tax=Rhizophagus clarus TaxID=94130 RepID=A0A2Z6S1Q5_9GLOM|nr:hypothetical protein RclHR1_08610011 [Rhizophagus clarus]GES99087.1 hypothetical protein GLOIN_2v812018 [Rhizophagus clarus]